MHCRHLLQRSFSLQNRPSLAQNIAKRSISLQNRQLLSQLIGKLSIPIRSFHLLSRTPKKPLAIRLIVMATEHKQIKTCGIIVIGDEILKAQVQDTNSHFLCRLLRDYGIRVAKISVIPDHVRTIANEIRTFSEQNDYVVTTGKYILSENKFHTYALYLSVDEVLIVDSLNECVNRHHSVIFGSYPLRYKTKITLEARSEAEMNDARSCLVGTLAPYVDVYGTIMNNESLAFAQHSLQVIESCLDKYSLDACFLSFNGGKDCTLLLHLVHAVLKHKGLQGKQLLAVYFKLEDSFPEVEQFVKETVVRYNLELIEMTGPMKEGLGKLLSERPHLKSVFMGSRRGDPRCEGLTEITKTDNGWPEIMRVNPMLDWSYKNVWRTIREFNIPYCTLYDQGMSSKKKPIEESDKLTRIAIVNTDKCKPKRCRQECKKSCPVVRMGKLCIEVTPGDKIASISEELCIGCGICVKKCPFEAITIINLPSNLEKDTTHRYSQNSFKLHRLPIPRPGEVLGLVGTNGIGKSTALKILAGCGICVKKCPFEAITIINLPSNLEKDTTHRYSQNSFKLHRLPIPRPGEVLGLVGTNGIGKSTALKILAGKQKPNLGRYSSPPDWNEILQHFRGSELQNYFTKILEDDLKALIKPQYVDQIPKAVKGTVQQLLDKKNEKDNQNEMCQMLELDKIRGRGIEQLSGGELQRFACAMVCIQAGDIFMFDEPSSYLDVKQRLKAAVTIRSLIAPDKFIIVVEHDLSVLDYLSDFICCLYGVPGAYGVVTMPFSVREGINIFLDGFVPTENLRFREESLVFKVAESAAEEEIKRMNHYEYPAMSKTMGEFKLEVVQGQFTDSEIIVLLGKTTFIRLLAGAIPPDEGSADLPSLNISYKPQKISPKSQGLVRQLLHEKIRDAYQHPQFVTDVMRPLKIDDIMDQEVQNLSGGELQRVALALCLGKPADVYLIDEPSAYLDSEQRLVAAKVIKRFILHAKKTGFVVEHDFIMATYLSDRVIVFEGSPSISTLANAPQNLLNGMNKFLSLLGITFRRDPNNFRPRINKNNSVKDCEQKRAGQYFFYEEP
uniref:ATP-binding cassette transporter n=1 Tax=Diaphorina citri TaxID=121845 RepID=A0A6G5VBK3_DIACI|nr:ATP-binding cassette transporter [Diaphorina citri]